MHGGAYACSWLTLIGASSCTPCFKTSSFHQLTTWHCRNIHNQATLKTLAKCCRQHVHNKLHCVRVCHLLLAAHCLQPRWSVTQIPPSYTTRVTALARQLSSSQTIASNNSSAHQTGKATSRACSCVTPRLLPVSAAVSRFVGRRLGGACGRV
jgi:hypothetical protein